MSRRRHTPEQIITALREAEVGLANGKTVGIVSREHGISEQTYYRWRNQYGGLKADDAKRLKELEAGNSRLKKIDAEEWLKLLWNRYYGEGPLFIEYNRVFERRQ